MGSRSKFGSESSRRGASAWRADGGADSDLVRRACAGSQDAYRALVLRFQRPLFSIVVRMVRDRQLAEDLTQEVFIKAFRALDSYDHRHKFSSWLFKIGHNTTIDYLRKGRLQTVPLTDPSSGALDVVDTIEDTSIVDPERARAQVELAGVLESAIAKLRPAYREMILLRHREELSYQEIGEITGASLSTVKTNLHRARKELAAILRPAPWRGDEP